MFSVIFEVHPQAGAMGPLSRQRQDAAARNWNRSTDFIDNIRYQSLTREGWILSLSGWRDEKAVVRWRTATSVITLCRKKDDRKSSLDYHLRVGQVTDDTHVPAGQTIQEQRLDETEIGEGTTISLHRREAAGLHRVKRRMRAGVAGFFGANTKARGLVCWDVFRSILKPDDLILMMVWKAKEDANALAKTTSLPAGGRLRHVRVVRDYGMLDRREAPQYYATVERKPHSL